MNTKPTNISEWIEANRNCFKPPICNKLLYVPFLLEFIRNYIQFSASQTNWKCSLLEGQTNDVIITSRRAKRFVTHVILKFSFNFYFLTFVGEFKFENFKFYCIWFGNTRWRDQWLCLLIYFLIWWFVAFLHAKRWYVLESGGTRCAQNNRHPGRWSISTSGTNSTLTTAKSQLNGYGLGANQYMPIEMVIEFGFSTSRLGDWTRTNGRGIGWPSLLCSRNKDNSLWTVVPLFGFGQPIRAGN